MRHAFMGHINSLTLYNMIISFFISILCYGFVFLFISCNSIHVGDSIISLRVPVIFVLAYLCHNFPFFSQVGLLESIIQTTDPLQLKLLWRWHFINFLLIMELWMAVKIVQEMKETFSWRYVTAMLNILVLLNYWLNY